MRRLVAWIWALATSATLAGCGSYDFKLAPVSGRVTVDGQPVAGLRVSFEPVGSVQRPAPGPDAIGITDTDGRYTVATIAEQWTGAVVGDCRVRIWTLPSNQSDPVFDDRDPNYDPVAEIKALKAKLRNSRKKVSRPSGAVPKRFNDESTLTFVVPPEGSDKANFEISWK
jgi:hypothetical protein